MGYTESFKLKVVAEYEQEKTSIEALRRKYNIGGNVTISRWVQKYGKNGLGSVKIENETDIRVNEKLDTIVLKNELEDARLRIAALEALIEASSKHTGIDLKKKFGGKPYPG